MKAIEAVLTTDGGGAVVETITLGYRNTYSTGVYVNPPSRILYQGRVFAMTDLVADEHGQTVYYGELAERDEAT